MLHAETSAANRNEVVSDVLHAIRARTGRRIDNLAVDCDGEVITVCGRASTYYAWQLAFAASRNASSELGGLLLDYQVQAKADAETVCVRPALRHSNVTLIANAHVKRLKTDAAGRAVTEVEVDCDGVPSTYRADVVVVSCGSQRASSMLPPA